MHKSGHTEQSSNVIDHLYHSRVCCRWFRNRRVEMEIPSRVMQKKLRRRLVDEDVGDEYFMPTNTIPIPIIGMVKILQLLVLGLALNPNFSLQWPIL